MAVDRNYRFNPQITTDEEGRAHLDISLEPTGDFTYAGGGGGGAEVGLSMGNDARYISIYVEARYDAFMQKPVFLGRLTFADESGTWASPLDGMFFPKIYGSLDTEGNLDVGATVLTSLVHHGGHSLYLETMLSYQTNINDMNVPGMSEEEKQKLLLGGGLMWDWNGDFSLRAGAMYSALDNNFGGVYVGPSVPVAPGTEIGVTYNLVPMYILGGTYWMHLFNLRVLTDFGIGYGQETVPAE